jgi:hypothetical protein
MATMLKIKKESELTPEYIEGKLYSFHNSAQKFHHDTNSFAKHEALGKFYEALIKYRDEIPEKLMGYMGGKRIGKIELDGIPEYSDDEAMKLVDEVKDFAYELYEWAGKKKYCDVENIAQELSGDAALTAYLLTLS